MKKHLTMTLNTLFALTLANSAIADEATVLNRNFDSDAINPSSGYTTYISGWVKSGTGSIGVEMPKGNSIDYTDMANRGQVAYLDAGGRFYQKPNAKIVDGESYTLTFDIGRNFEQLGLDFIARIKADGIGVAQIQLDGADVPAGNWVSKSLTFVANSSMPIDKQISIEFQNFATDAGYSINIDNVYLTTSSSASIIPPEGTIPKTLSIITEDTTLTVPDDYANINLALAYLDDKYINRGAVVTIQVADCSDQTYYTPIEVRHPHGQRIQILGDTGTPGACVLQFNGTSGIKVSNNKTLRLLNGFHIKGNGTEDTQGISATDGAIIKLGASMLVSDFNTGLHASYAGKVFANNIKSTFNTGAGIMSEYGGFIHANSSRSDSNASHGYFAVDGGEMIVDYSTANNNTSNGYYALLHGFIKAYSTSASGNAGGAGYYASQFSSIASQNSTSNNNNKGFYCDYQSYLDRSGSSSQSGNAIGISPAVNTLGNWHCLIH